MVAYMVVPDTNGDSKIGWNLSGEGKAVSARELKSSLPREKCWIRF